MTETMTPKESLRLGEIRDALLRLHSALIADERVGYEKLHGRVDSPHRMLDLLLKDPSFQWLRRFSATIVALDEGLSKAEGDAALLLANARALTSSAPEMKEHAAHYVEALQRSPEAALAHAALVKLVA